MITEQLDQIQAIIVELQDKLANSKIDSYKNIPEKLHTFLKLTEENLNTLKARYLELNPNDEPSDLVKVRDIRENIGKISALLENMRGEIANKLSKLFDVRRKALEGKASENARILSDSLPEKISALDDELEKIIIKNITPELEDLDEQIKRFSNPPTADNKGSTNQTEGPVNSNVVSLTASIIQEDVNQDDQEDDDPEELIEFPLATYSQEDYKGSPLPNDVEDEDKPFNPYHYTRNETIAMELFPFLKQFKTMNLESRTNRLIRSEAFYYKKPEDEDEALINEAKERERQEEEDRIMAENKQKEDKIIADEVEKVESSKSWEAIDAKTAVVIKANISAYLQDKKSFDHSERKYQMIRRNNDEFLEKGFLYLREGDGGFYYSCITPSGQEIHDKKLDIPDLSTRYFSKLTDKDAHRILTFVSDRQHILNKKVILDGLLENIYWLSLQPGYAKQMKSLYEIYVAFRNLYPNINDDLVSLRLLLENNQKTLTKNTRTGLFHKTVNVEIENIYKDIRNLTNTLIPDYLLRLKPVERHQRRVYGKLQN